MKDTRTLMGMPITVEIADTKANTSDLDRVYDYFTYVDEKFSPFKESSEISQINNGLINLSDISADMQEILGLCEQTKQETGGFFNILKDGKLDPSGLVKGWAINNAARLIAERGFENYYVDAGGDIQVHGKTWKVGIQNPFDPKQIVKALKISNEGIATSGTYLRGQHVYNPFAFSKPLLDVVSISVIGPNVYEADRFATAAFAMGVNGITFINDLPGFEGYMIDRKGVATVTTGFEKYLL